MKSRSDIFQDPTGDFISHEDYLLNLVQNIVFFCTKEYIVLYKGLYSFVQECTKMYRRIKKRWRVLEKESRVFAEKVVSVCRKTRQLRKILNRQRLFLELDYRFCCYYQDWIIIFLLYPNRQYRKWNIIQ